MGITDRQFDAYQQSLLRELKRALRELEEAGIENETIKSLIRDIESQLNRP